MKKIAHFIIVFCIFLFSLVLMVNANVKEPSLIVLGEVIKTADPPIIEKGNIYLPIRAVSEALGYSMDYNSKTKIIDIKKNSFAIKLTVGSKNAIVNGKKILLDRAPYLVNGRAYVPETFIYTGFCVSSEYNNKSNTVKIGSLSPLVKGEKIDKGLYIFDKKADNEFLPIVANKKIMVPLRPIGEGLGYDITWDIKTQTMALFKGNKSLSFVVNKDKAIVDGKELKMDEKTLMSGGRAYVTMTFLESVMEYGFQYDQVAKRMVIKEKEVPVIISKVQDISYSEESGYPQLYISTDNPVEYNTFTLDNPDRMVIDINNAIADTDYEVKEINSGDIIGVRIGQFSSQPKVVRIVVDLKNKKKAMVTHSADKKNISLAYANILQPVTIEKEGYCDVISIKGSQSVDSQLFSLDNPDRIVIDVQQAVLGGENQNIALNNSSIIKSVRTGQFDVGTARIVVDLGKSAFYEIKNEDNESKIYISDIPFSFMGYDKYYNSSYVTMNPNDEVDFKTDFDKKKNVLKVEINKDIEYDNELYEINDNLLEYIKLSKTQQKKSVITKAEFKLKDKVNYELLSSSNTTLIKLKLTHIHDTP
ncbi:MAG: AMIN domain-containing protein [Clostridiales bacterium]|nr:AMIN domain-containing protein [Clostridiales bacterium]